MNQIYSLRDDKHHIKNVQNATLTTDKYGVIPEHGLFGSDEWWSAIESGLIETFTIDGVISKVYMSGHNDFPEFKVESEGNVTSWERKGKEDLYIEGSAMKLEYVLTKSRFDHKRSPTLLNIWISE